MAAKEIAFRIDILTRLRLLTDVRQKRELTKMMVARFCRPFQDALWKARFGLRLVFIFPLFLGLLSVDALAQNDPTGVIRAVQSAGAQVSPRDLAHWLGDQAAYDSLAAFLQQPPVSGSDWRNAIDAIATIAGANSELGNRALTALEKFAIDDCYFGSTDTLPGAPMISEAAAAAKLEVPLAIGMLASSAHAGPRDDHDLHMLHVTADGFLLGAQHADFWKRQNVRWLNDEYFGHYEKPREHLCAVFAEHAHEAFKLLGPAPVASPGR